MSRVGRAFLASALALGVLAGGLLWLSPWPSVLAIRVVFDRGAATASVKLAGHLPADRRQLSALSYDPADPDAVLDIYYPSRVDPRAPTVVWIHGGGFVSGRREDIRNYLLILAARGFVVANVDYTIAPNAQYPVPVRQVSRALGFLDQNSARLGLNRNAVVLAGDSAGAQIAAEVANIITSPEYAKLTGITPPIAPDKLKGALLYCGIFDVGLLNADAGGVIGWFLRTVTWAYSGARDWRSVPGFETVSVASYVTPAFPSSFISAGNADPLAPQSRAMTEALEKSGVPVRALFYPKDHPARLGHEYQFDLETAEGKNALEQSVAWLQGLQE